MRNMTSGMTSQVTAKYLRPVIFVQIVFRDQTVYIWTGMGSITWNEHTWLGLGKFFGISAIPETMEVIAQGIMLILSGIPLDMIDEALNYCRPDSQVSIWFGAFDDTGALVADPTKIYNGHLDVPTINDDAKTCTLQISCENPLAALNQAPEYRYNDVDQQRRYPGDTGFHQAPHMANLTLQWPTKL